MEPSESSLTQSDAPSRDRRALVQSVSRALDILDLLREAGRPMSPADLAKAADLDRTVVYRLLRTLSQRQMVSEGESGFTLGPETVLLGHRYLDALPLRRIALPYMIDLQTKFLQDRPWTLALFIAIGRLGAVVERMWTAATPLGLVLDQGATSPLEVTAAGRGLLAYLDAAEAEAILKEQYSALRPSLEEIRAANGVALLHPSTSNGLEAVACVIRRPDGTPVAAIGVGGLDLGAELATDSTLATQLRHAADAIGRMIY
ncbi:MAG: hypothetical protein ABS81_06000 [Pseudonocardia sp. SCN 72-86]|nr:MAG: hypothetical protein ABS81_06000 [Pseudonocardia sp. SCN 72-86]